MPAMKRAIYKIAEGKPEVFDDVKKQEIFDYIKINQQTGSEVRQEHKQRVIAYKENYIIDIQCNKYNIATVKQIDKSVKAAYCPKIIV